MSNAFVSNMKKVNNYTLTENGALAMKSTNSAIVDLFGTIGSLRSRSVSEIERLFSFAFAEDKLLATKMAFYARNVRGGLGERDTARIIWHYLAESQPDIMRKNLEFIPVFGRWDDLYCLLDTPVEEDMWNLVRAQYKADVEGMKKGESISLMGKWLKNANSKNATYASWGMRTARALHMSDMKYRRARAALNDYLGVIECNMSNGDFSRIPYEAVSSRAMMIYRNAFKKRDPDGFQAYLDSLTKGETKVNASTLYPYDIMEKYGIHENWSWSDSHNYLSCDKPFDTVLEEQWKALPNYVEGENNVLVMADTSGSMSGRPLATSVGLALYFAERNKGAFQNVFMTFSDRPKFVTVKGSNLREKIGSVEAIVANTNIEAAFKLILKTSVENNVPAEDMPKALVIISDMEFDRATRWNDTYYNNFERMYAEAGYAVPTIIFWNVNSRHDVFHVACDKKGVQLASGSSASTFKSILANIGKTPYEAVVDTLNSEMYSMITV